MLYMESYIIINNAQILHAVMRYGINNNIDKKIIATHFCESKNNLQLIIVLLRPLGTIFGLPILNY